MDPKKRQYKDLEMFVTVLVIAMLALFIFYLIMAGLGQTVLKILCAILIFGISGFGLWFLYTSKELLRQRSIWMTFSFAGCALCTLVSLLAGYPGP